MCNWKDISIEGVAPQTEPGRHPLFAVVANAAQAGLSAMQVERLSILK
ncbi:hypothetical protein ACVWZZ_004534 [Bradyrhizobium sp. LM6.10]